MSYETTTALQITNGDRVLIDGEYRLITAAHYSGDVDGTGTTTLEHHSGQWQGPSATPVRRQIERTALIVGRGITAERVAAYLPAGYRVVEADVIGKQGDSVIIAGYDIAGWTLEDYVIPRLASGCMFATTPAYGVPTKDAFPPEEFWTEAPERTDRGDHLSDGMGADD